MEMKILNQRDSKWSGIKLGTSDTTIGSHGCTITCIAMASGLEPPEVNNRFNSNNVYSNGNLVTWTKIQAAIPWLQFEWRNYDYNDELDNQRVKSAIDKNGFCLVEVDFDRIPSTNDRHWVLYIGNGQMYDPWYGTQKSTSYYPAVGYAIINKVGEPQSSIYRGLDLSNQESMKVCVDDHLKIVEGQLVDKSQYEAVKGKLEKSEERVGELSQQLGSANGTIKALTEKIESQNNIIGEFQKEDAVQIKTLRDSYDAQKIAENRLSDLLWELEDSLHLPHTADDMVERISVAVGALQSVLRQNDHLQTKSTDLEKEVKRLNALRMSIDKQSTKSLIIYLLGRLLKRS